MFFWNEILLQNISQTQYMYHLCNKILFFRNKILWHLLYTAQTKHIVHKCSKSLLLEEKKLITYVHFWSNIYVCAHMHHVLNSCQVLSRTFYLTVKDSPVQSAPVSDLWDRKLKRKPEGRASQRNRQPGMWTLGFRVVPWGVIKWIQPCVPKCA